MATQLATTDENPMKKFDTPVLKNMGNTQLDGGAPRAMFLPTNMGEAMELAKLMASSNFVPPHLRGKPGDCLAVVMQAGRWAMDPFSVGNKSYFVNDRIAYEAQLVHAVINSAGVLDGKLKPEWEGEGDALKCTVRGKLKGEDEILHRTVKIKNITTRNSPLWKQDPEQQLAYYATRAWVRLHAPEVLMGVYTPDELSQNMGTAGAASEVRELRPLTTAMLIEQQASEDIDEQTGEVLTEGRDPADMGEGYNGTDEPLMLADELIGHINRKTKMQDVIELVASHAASIASYSEDDRARVAEAQDRRVTLIKGAK
tara:strand:+ start:4783 stop:5724 length:942 start_codon:yes stop_codon:yes gene_type:complete